MTDKTGGVPVMLTPEQGQQMFITASQHAWFLLTALDKHYGEERVTSIVERAIKKSGEPTGDDVRDFIYRTTGLKFNPPKEEPDIIIPEGVDGD
jgi:hypothetical protein